MLVMCVRVVRVSVLERVVVVRVAVRFFAIPREIVLVLMVFIMQMGVRIPPRQLSTLPGEDVLWTNADADARGWQTNLEGEVRGLNLN